jgi:hypothetical protein
MRLFDFPARYTRFVTAQLALMGAEIRRDADRRDDEDPRVRRLATIPGTFIDPAARGRVIVLVGVPDSLSDTDAITAVLQAASRPTLPTTLPTLEISA